MKRISCIFFFFFSLFTKGYTQEIPMTAEEKAALDSILSQDVLMQMLLEMNQPRSYFQVNAGVGNSYFSIKNRRVNATQVENKIVGTGSVGYFHKSGISLGAGAFMSHFNNSTGFYQYSITPSYSYTRSKKIDASLSYTRYIRRKGLENGASPFQNEIYASSHLKKPWIQPGIAIGYLDGKFTEYKKIDTVLFGIRRVFTDTMNVTLSQFSLNASIQHSFEWYKILNKNDGIVLVPSFYLNAGSGSHKVVHQNPFFAKLNARPNRLKNVGTSENNSSFDLLSVAMGTDIFYLIGKVGIRLQGYFDYYLPETTDKRFTSIFSCNLSYTFY